ncbi:MAG TPA: polyphosphate--glucose phosphotransferase [Cyclobacteriaceae bacterium]
MEVLGIDVGGSGIKGALVDTKKGELLTDRKRISTPQPATPESVIGTVCEVVKFFKWEGIIGCGVPSAVRHGIVKTASNVDDSWIGVDAPKMISRKTGCPTYVLNDVDAAGLAEMKFGAGKKAKGVTMVVAAGTGIGTALFIGKKLVPNTELGHVKIDDMVGEDYAANSVREENDLAWEEWATRFNRYLNRLEALFWPDLFILGGGVCKKFDKYAHCFKLEAKVVPAENRNHAGIIGAALSAKKKLK